MGLIAYLIKDVLDSDDLDIVVYMDIASEIQQW